MDDMKQALLLCVLLAGLFGLLMLPTMKSLKQVERDPNSKGFEAEANQTVARNLKMPRKEINYVIVWSLEEVENAHILLSPSVGYEGETRTAEHPSYIMREGRSALAFYFPTLHVSEDSRYDIILQKEEGSRIKLEYPLNAQIKTGEQVSAAFQLAQRKNWITSLIDKVYAENLIGNDISMYLHRGQQIASGTNPYSCVLEKGACIGYPAHTPGMYLLASGFVLFGVHDLDSWAAAWRPVAIMSWLAVGIVLLVHFIRRGQVALAVAVFGFWLFNRWSLDVLRIAHTDFLGVFFLLTAILLAEKRPKTAALVLGVSLAIKQIAILIVPLFLIVLWRSSAHKLSKIAVLFGLILLVPMLTLAPFLLDNAPATMTGLLNPVERNAQQVHGFAGSFAQSLDITNTSKIFLLLYLVGIVYIAAYQRTISLAGGTLMIFIIMISFTHVLYNQYIVWMLPFITLALPFKKKQRDTTT